MRLMRGRSRKESSSESDGGDGGNRISLGERGGFTLAEDGERDGEGEEAPDESDECVSLGVMLVGAQADR